MLFRSFRKGPSMKQRKPKLKSRTRGRPRLRHKLQLIVVRLPPPTNSKHWTVGSIRTARCSLGSKQSAGFSAPHLAACDRVAISAHGPFRQILQRRQMSAFRVITEVAADAPNDATDPKRSSLWLSICAASKTAGRLLDYLVGGHKQSLRHGEAERLSRPEIKDQL